jgi:hypothetical protein
MGDGTGVGDDDFWSLSKLRINPIFLKNEHILNNLHLLESSVKNYSDGGCQKYLNTWSPIKYTNNKKNK